jgi:hypothetical protein
VDPLTDVVSPVRPWGAKLVKSSELKERFLKEGLRVVGSACAHSMGKSGCYAYARTTVVELYIYIV